jgi:NAD+ diphosphatase
MCGTVFEVMSLPVFQQNTVLIPPDTLTSTLPEQAVIVELPGVSYAEMPADSPVPAGWRAISVRQAVSDGDKSLLQAYHIMQWYRESRFCGACSCRNGDSPHEIARVCPDCGRVEYPRISPAIIVVITNDVGQILLAHNSTFKAGMYSLIAGFVEAGENLETTVVREIHEEVNISVKDIRYCASQPWPFPNSLMIGFSARYASGIVKPDGIEIEDARWFSRNALPMLPAPGSLSRYLIDTWIDV